MIHSAAQFFTRFMQRWLPDAFVIAILLTALVWILGVTTQSVSPVQMTLYWGDSIWNLLGFSMQMVLILVLGHVVAESPPVKKVLTHIACSVKSPTQAVVTVTLVSAIACWLNWGFGLIVGAFLAKEIATHYRKVHYPLLVAAAYSGFLVWHAGLSGSIPLKLSSPGNDALGDLLNQQSIATSLTIFSWPTLSLIVALIVLLVIINSLMHPSAENSVSLKNVEADRPQQSSVNSTNSLAQKIENHSSLSLLLVIMIAVYLFSYFSKGRSLGLNTVNILLLMVGLLLHRSPKNYVNALQQSLSGVGGIILQFPLYAGLMGMMSQSGIAQSISNWFVDISTPATFNLFTFISAGIVNFFVPSGGGQWAVQAPIVMPAAAELGIALERAAMAVAFGDAWTNMAQPFWALPLLGIAGLSIRDIMGYCCVILLASGLLMGLWITLFF